MEKVCTKCRQQQPLSAFPKSGGKGDLSTWCRGCHAARFQKKSKEQWADVGSRTDVLAGFPVRLRAAREAAGYTQQQFGAIAGVGGPQVYLWESGQSIPRGKVLRAIFEHFGWEIPTLLLQNKQGAFPLAVADCPVCKVRFPVFKMGVECCSRKCSGVLVAQRQGGKSNPSWSGGKWKTVNGYAYRYVKGDPLGEAMLPKSGGRYVLEHRYVMATHIGRPLLPAERVHHKNGVRDDNRIDNLELWTLDHKDPAGVRVVDMVVSQLMCQPELLSLTAAQRKKVLVAAQRISQLPIFKA